MAEDQGNQEEKKFDFTGEGEVVNYISLAQARLLAIQTARESPGEYGSQYQGVPMVFESVDDSENEDYYVVTLSLRPQGDFSGRPGQEQFFIEKEGTVAVRQVLSLPRRGGRLPVLPVAIGLVVVGVIAAVAAVFALSGSVNGRPSVAVASPTETPASIVAQIPSTDILTPATAAPIDTPVPPTSPRPTPTTSANSYFDKGMEYYDADNWLMAVEQFTLAIGVNSQLKDAYFNRGYAYDELGQYQTAITDYTKAIQLEPDDALYYYNRGIAYRQLGQYQTAITDFTKAIQLDTNFGWAYNSRGHTYIVLGQHQNAIADHTKAIQLDTDDADYYNSRGAAYIELGQYQAAIADYSKAIQINPDYAMFYYNRGITNYHLGEYQAAIADYSKAIQIDLDDADAYYNRGNVYLGLGQSSLAAADKTKACSLDSTYC
jgi:tetratricopeptide (TPR) repeat protein